MRRNAAEPAARLRASVRSACAAPRPRGPSLLPVEHVMACRRKRRAGSQAPPRRRRRRASRPAPVARPQDTCARSRPSESHNRRRRREMLEGGRDQGLRNGAIAAGCAGRRSSSAIDRTTERVAEGSCARAGERHGLAADPRRADVAGRNEPRCRRRDPLVSSQTAFDHRCARRRPEPAIA